LIVAGTDPHCRVGLAHENADLAARIGCVCGVPFAADDDVMIAIELSMLVASLDATAGLVIAKHERISPASSGFSQRS
jgi:hypothetical protein